MCRGLEESDMTERLHFHFSLSCIGEGNGNPLQCSCLENPRGGGAWWAAVYGITQSQTHNLAAAAACMCGSRGYIRNLCIFLLTFSVNLKLLLKKTKPILF